MKVRGGKFPGGKLNSDTELGEKRASAPSFHRPFVSMSPTAGGQESNVDWI